VGRGGRCDWSAPREVARDWRTLGATLPTRRNVRVPMECSFFSLLVRSKHYCDYLRSRCLRNVVYVRVKSFKYLSLENGERERRCNLLLCSEFCLQCCTHTRVFGILAISIARKVISLVTYRRKSYSSPCSLHAAVDNTQ